MGPTSEYEDPADRPQRLQALLSKKLGPEYLSTRQGPGGAKLTYVEGWRMIALANEVFGFNGWSSEVIDITLDFCDIHEETMKFSAYCTARVRVTIADGAFHEDVGSGKIENAKSKADAIDKIKKEAVTDATKRALRYFGNLMGNCVYDKHFLDGVSKIKQPPKPKFDFDELHRPGQSISAPYAANVGARPAVTMQRNQPVKQEAGPSKPGAAVNHRVQPIPPVGVSRQASTIAAPQPAHEESVGLVAQNSEEFYDVEIDFNETEIIPEEPEGPMHEDSGFIDVTTSPAALKKPMHPNVNQNNNAPAQGRSGPVNQAPTRGAANPLQPIGAAQAIRNNSVRPAQQIQGPRQQQPAVQQAPQHPSNPRSAQPVPAQAETSYGTSKRPRSDSESIMDEIARRTDISPAEKARLMAEAEKHQIFLMRREEALAKRNQNITKRQRSASLGQSSLDPA